MDNLYIVSKKKDQQLTMAQIMNSYCQTQTEIEESRENN